MSSDGYALDVQHDVFSSLQRGIGRLRARLRGVLALRLASIGIAAMAGIAALAILILRLFGMQPYPWAAEIGLGGVTIAACVTAAVWRLPDTLVAGSVDHRLGLRDRLGTAVRIAPHAGESGMAHAAVLDAATTVTRLHPADVYPVRAYRSLKLMAACLVALALAQALPIPPLFLSQQQRDEKQELRREAAALEPIAKKLLDQSKASSNDEAEKLARRMSKLAEQFKRGTIGKKEALLSLGEVQKDLEKLQAPVAMPQTAARAAEALQQENRESMAAEAQRLADKAGEAGDREAQRQLADLAAKARQAKSPAEMKQLREQLRQKAQAMGQTPNLPSPLAADLASSLADRRLDDARKELGELKNALNSNMSEAERQQLAKDLQRMAQGLQQSDLKDLAKQMSDAAKAASQGNMQQAKQALAEAAKECKAKGG